MWGISSGLLLLPRLWRLQRRKQWGPWSPLPSRSYSAIMHNMALQEEKKDPSQMPPATFFSGLDLSWGPVP